LYQLLCGPHKLWSLLKARPCEKQILLQFLKFDVTTKILNFIKGISLHYPNTQVILSCGKSVLYNYPVRCKFYKFIEIFIYFNSVLCMLAIWRKNVTFPRNWTIKLRAITEFLAQNLFQKQTAIGMKKKESALKNAVGVNILLRLTFLEVIII